MHTFLTHNADESELYGNILLFPPTAKPTPYGLAAFLQHYKHKEELPEASYRA